MLRGERKTCRSLRNLLRLLKRGDGKSEKKSWTCKPKWESRTPVPGKKKGKAVKRLSSKNDG